MCEPRGPLSALLESRPDKGFHEMRNSWVLGTHVRPVCPCSRLHSLGKAALSTLQRWLHPAIQVSLIPATCVWWLLWCYPNGPQCGWSWCIGGNFFKLSIIKIKKNRFRHHLRKSCVRTKCCQLGFPAPPRLGPHLSPLCHRCSCSSQRWFRWSQHLILLHMIVLVKSVTISSSTKGLHILCF